MKCLINNVRIKAIATCLPERSFEMESLKLSHNDKTIDITLKATGIVRTHQAEENVTTSDLCFRAAEEIFNSGVIERSEIDGVVFVSQTFDYLDPATSVVLQHRLGLSQETVCFDISYGCSGYIYGLFQSCVLIKSGACKNVLLMAGDTNSKMMDMTNLSKRMVFGDAGSASIISEGDSSMGFHICSNGGGADVVMNTSGGFRNWPANKQTMISDNTNNGDDVFSFIVSCGPKTIKTMLEFMGWDKDEVDFYGLHQATRITIDYMRKKLKIAEDKTPFGIKNYGNTGPTTVPLILTDYPNGIERKDTSTWHKVILAAYGVGLSWGSVACDLSQTRLFKPINQDLR